MKLAEAISILEQVSATGMVSISNAIALMQADALQKIAYQLDKLSNIPSPIKKDWRGYGFINIRETKEGGRVNENKTLDSNK